MKGGITLEARCYQKKAKVDIYDAWRVHKSVMFQLTTGGGKTVIFTNIIRDILKKKKRVMMVAHREELIFQAWNTLYKNKIYSGIIKGNAPTDYSLPCQVASIQTLANREKLPKCDVIIFDEAHHCQSDNSYGKLIRNKFPDAKILGVTATPYRLSGHGFTDMFDKLILSKSYKELVDLGYLTPYSYFLGESPDLESIGISKGEYKDSDAAEAMDLVPLVESYLEHANGMKGVVFAVNIEHSKSIVEKYRNAGITAEHLDGQTSPDQRKAILKRFKEGKTMVLVNVGIVTEGFDLPDMEFIQLARPTMSLSLFLQMVGRPARVIYDVIKGFDSPEERRNAIADSSKPKCIILDNAGCYQTHGLPDDYRNWPLYFAGFDKKKIKKEEEMIEMIEFIAEDKNGIRIKSKDINEVKGLKLVEVKHTIRETIMRFTSIKKFDELLSLAHRLKAVKKKGWFTLLQYVEHCEKNHTVIDDKAMAYIIDKLSTQPREAMDKADLYFTNTQEGIKENYPPEQWPTLLEGLAKQFKRMNGKHPLFYIPRGAIRSKINQHRQKMSQLNQRKKQIQHEKNR